MILRQTPPAGLCVNGDWRCRVWKELVKQTMTSAFQEDVSVTLREMGIAHDFEYETEDGLFSLDIAFTGAHSRVSTLLFAETAESTEMMVTG